MLKVKVKMVMADCEKI